MIENLISVKPDQTHVIERDAIFHWFRLDDEIVWRSKIELRESVLSLTPVSFAKTYIVPMSNEATAITDVHAVRSPEMIACGSMRSLNSSRSPQNVLLVIDADVATAGPIDIIIVERFDGGKVRTKALVVTNAATLLRASDYDLVGGGSVLITGKLTVVLTNADTAVEHNGNHIWPLLVPMMAGAESEVTHIVL